MEKKVIGFDLKTINSSGGMMNIYNYVIFEADSSAYTSNARIDITSIAEGKAYLE